MPELPEVYGYQQYIEKTSLNKKITAFDCRDKRLLKKSTAEFEEHLIGQKFTGSKRIGKYLFLKTNGDKNLLMHFGMTGRPTYYKEEDDRPKYGHVVFTFENGFHLAFENKRKFGRLDLLDSIEEYQKKHKLSDDARELKLKDFIATVQKRKTDIKKVLMDQSVAAGIGNWMADDILYQARIHPEKKASDLSEKEIKTIFEKMQYVIETAIKFEAHYKDFPEEFLIHNREKGAKCFHTAGKIEKIKVGGRSTYFSPQWQKL
ncbi:formamidopyrimidine-DNA glycosylase [Flavobacteriaceae bacterium MAR_2010_188]|nr:formamidopyrimidine-DNA glycosylase [Flavobacteriaceae bacterium MAR_2010_188]